MNTLNERVAQRAEATTHPVDSNSLRAAKPSSTADLIRAMAPEIKKALPSVMSPERFSRIALSAVKNTPKLAECTPLSFLAALMNAAQLEYYSENLEVCTRDELPTVIARFWKEFPNCLDEKQVENLYNKLLPLAKQDTLRKNKHIEDIKDRLNSEELCPKCGNQLVLRTARSGPNAGKQFWGCSNYPRCTYLRNL